MGKGDRHKLLADAQGNSGNTSSNSNEKKITRKEIEQKRRQHMSNLHASLRSLLPLESIKGKRSASDHINEAVNYIKYLENNIQELSFKRDQLKNISNLEAFDQGGSSSNNCSMKCVTINPYSGGLKIIISGGVVGEDLQLSRVLEALLEDGLDVVSFVSSQTVDGFFHTIQTEYTVKVRGYNVSAMYNLKEGCVMFISFSDAFVYHEIKEIYKENKIEGKCFGSRASSATPKLWVHVRSAMLFMD